MGKTTKCRSPGDAKGGILKTVGKGRNPKEKAVFHALLRGGDLQERGP